MALQKIGRIYISVSDDEDSHGKVEDLILDKHENKPGTVEPVLLPIFGGLEESQGH